MNALLAALLLDTGYNTRVVILGAAMLGAAAGAVGAFVLLRRRSLVSDAVGHASLPGLALAFIVAAALTGNGRWLPGLMLGAALSAALGLVFIGAMVARTRLHEDAAIGAVLSSFFGAGVVLLTVIQSMQTGNQAGIGSYLLGSAAGMLRSEAELIAAMATLSALAIFLLRRRLALVAFDPDYAAVRGINVRAADLALSLVLLAVVITGLKVVGLVLAVAITIMPAAAARFWTDRVHRMVPMAAALGACGGYVGAAISSTQARLPTGSVIVLTMFAFFVVSLLLAPRRGVLAAALRHRTLSLAVHRRQGLLALARGEPIYDRLTLRVLRRAGLARRDGMATPAGATAARAAAEDEALWKLYQRMSPADSAATIERRVRPIREVLPADTVAELERCLHTAGGCR